MMQQYGTMNLASNRPLVSGLVQRRCACGKPIVANGECAECRRKRQSLQRQATITSRSAQQPTSLPGMPGAATPMGIAPPVHQVNAGAERDFSQVPAVHDATTRRGLAKGVGEIVPEEGQTKPRPTQGSATIQCDGSGGYEVVLNSWSSATCGTKGCVIAHESSHIADWQAKWPTGCTGQPKGYLPQGDPPDSPLMTAAEYNAFLKASECKAHTVDLNCAKSLPQTGGCKKTVEDYIDLTEKQRKNWCPALSRGAKVAIGLGGGAAAGAGIGALAGGPIGAAIGAGVGALVGGIAGAFL